MVAPGLFECSRRRRVRIADARGFPRYRTCPRETGRSEFLRLSPSRGARLVRVKWSWSMSLGSLAPLPADPLPDVSRAAQQLDAVSFMRGEEAHHREIHECRLRQVEHEPRTVPLHLRLQIDQVILVDLPTEPERRRLAVTSDFDLQSHRCRRTAN